MNKKYSQLAISACQLLIAPERHLLVSAFILSLFCVTSNFLSLVLKQLMKF